MCFRINYRRWAVIDMALKSSHYPKEMLDLFEEKGAWRSNLTSNLGSFMPVDQFHEQGKYLTFSKALNT